MEVNVTFFGLISERRYMLGLERPIRTSLRGGTTRSLPIQAPELPLGDFSLRSAAYRSDVTGGALGLLIVRVALMCLSIAIRHIVSSTVKYERHFEEGRREVFSYSQRCTEASGSIVRLCTIVIHKNGVETAVAKQRTTQLSDGDGSLHPTRRFDIELT